jgi:hypothetical protein
MKALHWKAVSLLAMFACKAHGQQFEGIIGGLDYPGISAACLNALNTTVAKCPAFLASVSVDNPRLNTDQLSALCITSCKTALTSARGTIATACKALSDTIELPDGVVYPGMGAPHISCV